MVRAKPHVVKTSGGKKTSLARNSTAAPSPPSFVKSTQKPAVSFITTSCCGCRKIITDDIKALQCDGCQSSDSWKCIDCLHLSENMCDQLVGEHSMSLEWFCDPCEKSISDNSLSSNVTSQCEHVSMIERLIEKYENFDKKNG